MTLNASPPPSQSSGVMSGVWTCRNDWSVSQRWKAWKAVARMRINALSVLVRKRRCVTSLKYSNVRFCLPMGYDAGDGPTMTSEEVCSSMCDRLSVCGGREAEAGLMKASVPLSDTLAPLLSCPSLGRGQDTLQRLHGGAIVDDCEGDLLADSYTAHPAADVDGGGNGTGAGAEGSLKIGQQHLSGSGCDGS